jgi:hypothetical protein
MIQYFKLGSWDRLILLLLIFILIQFPFCFLRDEILLPELLWLRLGQRLSEGWRIYSQTLDDSGPLSAFIYAGLAKLGFNTFHIFRYLGSALILIQAFWLNQICRRFALFPDRNFIIAFFYILFAHIGPDAVSLSPTLMASTFIVMAYGRIFKIIRFGPNNNDTMYLGISIGLATLCYQPSVLFFLSFCLSAVFFSGMRLNQYFIVLVAMLLPSAIVYTFFSLNGGESEFWHCFLSPFQLGFYQNWVGWDLILGFGGFLFLLSLLGWAIANKNSRVNFQLLGFTVFFFGLIISVLSVFIGGIQSTYQLVFLVPHTAFFMAQFVSYSKSILIQEILVLFTFLIIIGSFFGMSDPSFGKQIFGHKLFIEEPPKGFIANFKNKQLLLLSNDFRFYKYNQASTRFFKFYLSGLNKDLSQTHEGLIFWYQCLEEDPPKLIYDPEDFIPAIAVRIPEFGKCYRASFYPKLYEAIPGTRFGTGSQ